MRFGDEDLCYYFFLLVKWGFRAVWVVSKQAVPSTIHQRRNEEASSTEKEKGLAGAILDESIS